MTNKYFLKCFSIFVLELFLSLSHSIASEENSFIQKAYTTWKVTVYPTDTVKDLFWLSEEEGRKAIEENKAYSKTKLSNLTFSTLSETSQKGLQKYGSFVDKEGNIYSEFKDVILTDNFAIDESQYLGYGDCGCVYLAQDISTKNFCAVKSQGRSDEKDFNVMELEINNLKKTGRFIKHVRESASLLIFQHLVDGTFFPGRYYFKQKDFSADHVALISWNFLREIIYLGQQKALTGDLAPNLMLDQYGRVFRIDMMSVDYTGKDIPDFDLDQEMDLYCGYGLTIDRVVYGFFNIMWEEKDLSNSPYLDFQKFIAKNNPHKNKNVKITWRTIFEKLKAVIIKNKTFEKINKS